MRLTVDATDLPRNLLRSRVFIPVPAGVPGAPGDAPAATDPRPVDLYYIIWTPGNHTPSGPVENIGSLVFRDDQGRALEWDRDPTAVERLTVRVPRDAKTIIAELTYIAGQPNPNSRSSDSYGRATFGALNWNTVLLYPGGVGHQNITVQAELARPAGWRFATALPPVPGMGDETTTIFEPVTLAQLIDCPVILGEHLNSIILEAPGDAPHFLHVVAAEQSKTKVPDRLKGQYERMIAECMAIFEPLRGPGREVPTPFPRDRYHFLHLLGIPNISFGLEHATSTLIASGADVYSSNEHDDLRGGGGHLLIVPHEYFHVWCGKLHAPAGLITPEYHLPSRTELLWVYEGLTDYYTDVLGARSGMITLEEYGQMLADLGALYELRAGRLWRSVEDTARAARHLRQPSLSWFALRQGQEYYGQGALFWLEADLIIRRATGNAKTLDDFCRAFFAGPIRPVGDPATYTRADIVAGLSALHPGQDWDALIRARIESPAESLDLGPLFALAGRRLEYAPEPTALQKKTSAKESDLNMRHSVGLRLSKEGEVTDLIPGSPADQAGLAFGTRIMAVNNLTWTADRMKEAVKNSAERGAVELIVSWQDQVRPVTIRYNGGHRWPRLSVDEGGEDLLAKIAAPRVPPAPIPDEAAPAEPAQPPKAE